MGTAHQQPHLRGHVHGTDRGVWKFKEKLFSIPRIILPIPTQSALYGPLNRTSKQQSEMEICYEVSNHPITIRLLAVVGGSALPKGKSSARKRYPLLPLLLEKAPLRGLVPVMINRKRLITDKHIAG